MTEVRTDTVAADDEGVRLDRWLRRRYPALKQGMIEKLLRTGQIRVDGGRAKSNTRLTPGQEVRIPPLPENAGAPAPTGQPASPVSAKDAAFIRSLILYQDDQLIALNKPAGIAVQGGSKQTRHIDAMLPALAGRSGETPRLIHRLDRDTSGVLVVAKTGKAAADLSAAFRSRAAKKTYWAIVLGAPRPPEGEMSGWLQKGAGGAKGREQMELTRQGGDAQHSRTFYTVLAEAGRAASWVALRPVTGRTHQLRVHMSALGHAIAGDRKYVCDRPTPNALEGKLQLHARSLVLPRKGGDLYLEAPPPPHMQAALDTLGLSEAELPRDPFAGLDP